MTDKPNVLVVGGAGGIGAACCDSLANLWRPIVADVDDETAASVAKRTGGYAIHFDVTDVDAIESAVSYLEATLGPLYALVFAAGLVRAPLSPQATDIGDYDRVFAVNTRGAFATTRAVAAHMAKRGTGSIVLIASLAGMYSTPHPAYGPSKAAMISLATSLSVHWGRHGVRVNSVSPGPVCTPLIEASYARGERDPEEMARNTALGRVIQPSEVAAPIAFLLSPAASAITGANLVIDAGMSAALTWNMYGGAERVLHATQPLR